MNYSVKFACIALIAIIAGSCAANKISTSDGVITPVADKKVIAEGSIVYALPLTVVDIEIEAERVVEKPGPYARFAGDFLGLTDVIRNEKETWTITGITVNTHEEPDPDEFYVIESKKVFETNVLALKRTGLILDLNPEFYNSQEITPTSSHGDLNRHYIYDLGSDEYFENKRDTLYRVVNLDTAFVRIPYLVVKKQKLSIEQLAENAAVRLMELRDGKHMILTGETNVFPQDDASINELNRLEKEYTELFTGKILKEERKFNYQVIPSKDMAGKIITLDKFSEITGPGRSAEGTGFPIVVEFVPESTTRNLKIFTDKSIDATSGKYDRLFYRIPDVVTVKISAGEDVIGTSRKLIFQFGDVIKLPNNYIIQSYP